MQCDTIHLVFLTNNPARLSTSQHSQRAGTLVLVVTPGRNPNPRGAAVRHRVQEGSSRSDMEVIRHQCRVAGVASYDVIRSPAAASYDVISGCDTSQTSMATGPGSSAAPGKTTDGFWWRWAGRKLGRDLRRRRGEPMRTVFVVMS